MALEACVQAHNEGHVLAREGNETIHERGNHHEDEESEKKDGGREGEQKQYYE